MKDFKIIDRELTSEELEQMRAGFNRNSLDHGVAYKDGDQYSGWFYLTDLFVDKEYRLQGLGSKLLGMLEEKIISMGLKQIWTWTAGYEAPEFYLKQGYQIFAALENWYSDGSSRIGLRKELEKDHNR
jgi:ribosomal protein S18 acetylase RimI-like enzyme